MEGGIDLLGLPFTGCLNTFLPHTRTAQSFSATLKDFTGPSPLASCRTPISGSTSTGAGGSVSPGSSVQDTVTESTGAGFTPTGGVAFFLCGPTQVTAAGCPAGGTQVGAAKPLVAGAASSDVTAATSAAGRYCWRTEYTPDAVSQGVYLAATHTNATSECFTVAAAPAPGTPGLPNTGHSAASGGSASSAWALVAAVAALAAATAAWGRAGRRL